MSIRSLKVIVVGDDGVGKTALINRFVGGWLQDDDDGLTADFCEKSMTIDDQKLIVSFWDQPNIEPSGGFYEGANGCCMVFSTLQMESFGNLQRWYENVRRHCGDHLPAFVVVENKIDLIDRSQVDVEQVEQAARVLKLRLYRTSAETGHQVTDMFQYIVEKAVRRRKELDTASPHAPMKRTPSTASWSLPNSSSTTGFDSDGGILEPSKRRTRGVKAIFNKNKCPIM